MSVAKSHHLRCYPSKIRPKNDSSQAHKITPPESFYYSISMSKYMEGGTLYIGRSDLESKMIER